MTTIAERVKRILSWLMVALVGRWEWRAPVWLIWARAQCASGWRNLAAHPKHASTLALAMVSTVERSCGMRTFPNRTM